MRMIRISPPLKEPFMGTHCSLNRALRSLTEGLAARSYGAFLDKMEYHKVT